MRVLVLVTWLVSGALGATIDGATVTWRGAAGRIHPFTQYMTLKSVSRAILCSCGSKLEKTRMVTAVSAAGATALLVDANANIDLPLLMDRFFNKRQQTAVFVDLNCAYVFDFIQKAGTFEYMTHWLLFAGEEHPAEHNETRGWGAGRALQAARRLPLTLNTQLLLLLPKQGTWYAFDIYTIDYIKQTPLNVTFFGIYCYTLEDTEGIYQVEDNVRYPSSLIYNINESDSIKDIEKAFAKYLQNVLRVVEGTPLLAGMTCGSGGCSAGGAWHVLLTDTSVARRRNWYGLLTLRATYVLTGKPAHITDWEFLKSTDVSHADASPRYVLKLVWYMQDMYNFPMTLQRAAQWAGQHNGSWLGIAGALLAGGTDLGVAPMAIKASRYDALEFSGLTSVIKLSTVFRQPVSLAAPTLAVFTAPLTRHAWCAALPMCALVVLLIAVTGRLETHSVRTAANNYCFGFGAILLDFVNIFYLNASFRSGGWWAGRVLALVAGSLGLLLMQFYSASLLAIVLAPPPKLINSLRDLLASDMRYKTEDVAYHRQFFKENMDNPDIAKLYTTKVTQGSMPPFISNEDGLKEVREGNFAFQGTSTFTYPVLATWSDDEVCTLDELHVFQPLQQYVTVARGSPYRQHVTTALVTMHERGVSARVKPMYFLPFPRCPPEHASVPTPVGRQFYPALHMLAILSAVSIGIFILEILINYLKL